MTTETVMRNGVDTTALFGALDAVKGQPEAAKFQYRATNTWVSGTHSVGRIDGFFGLGAEQSHLEAHSYDADHPRQLVGTDVGPTPAEFLLHALAACITAGIGNIAAVPNIMSIHPGVPAADMASFIKLALAKPRQLSFASAGIGSVSHLLGEQFNLATGADIVHIPYRGVGPALNDAVSGQVHVMYDNLPTSLQIVRDGRLRALGVSGASQCSLSSSGM